MTLRVSSIEPPASVPSQRSLDHEKEVSFLCTDFYAQQRCLYPLDESCAKRRRTTSSNVQYMDQEQLSTANPYYGYVAAASEHAVGKRIIKLPDRPNN
jgi:hypothetical protein